MISSSTPAPGRKPAAFRAPGASLPACLAGLLLGLALLLCNQRAMAQPSRTIGGPSGQITSGQIQPERIQPERIQPEHIQPGQIKSDLKEILSAPEFQTGVPEQGPIARALESVRTQLETWWRDIRNFFRRLFGDGNGGPGNVSPILVYVLIGAGAGVALGLLYRVMLAYSRQPRKPATTVKAVTMQPPSVDEPQRAPDEWIAEAERLAQRQDFRAAFRAAFLALLVQLDRAGTIEFRPSRTNGDYLRSLAMPRLRALYDLIFPLTRDFDRQWYGGRPSGEADYQRCLNAYRQLPEIIAANTAGATGAPAADAPATQAAEG